MEIPPQFLIIIHIIQLVNNYANKHVSASSFLFPQTALAERLISLAYSFRFLPR
ncbi:MAG: hypothetical protein LBH80_01165 [Prevotellaceae bacterium]|jgi:hypothetical protein|nr:hypothetical protein [Prevotellaceae bacterium]